MATISTNKTTLPGSSPAETSSPDRAAEIRTMREQACGLTQRGFALARSVKTSAIHAAALGTVLADLEAMAENKDDVRNLQDIGVVTTPERKATETRDHEPARRFPVGIQAVIGLLRGDKTLTRAAALGAKTTFTPTV